MSAKVTISLPLADSVSGELPEVPELITVSRAAELLGLSRQAVHKMVKAGRLQAWRLRSAGNDRPLVMRESDVLAMKPSSAEVIPDPSGLGAEVPA